MFWASYVLGIRGSFFVMCPVKLNHTDERTLSQKERTIIVNNDEYLIKMVIQLTK